MDSCTPSAASTLYNWLPYLIRSVLSLIRTHDVIMKESLKWEYLSLYVANLIASNRTLLNAISYLCILMNALGLDSLPRYVLLRWSQLGDTKLVLTRINWLTDPTRNIKALRKCALFWWTHENLANCRRSVHKIWHVVEISIQNVTRV